MGVRVGAVHGSGLTSPGVYRLCPHCPGITLCEMIDQLSSIFGVLLIILSFSRAQDGPGLTHSIAIFLAAEPDELIDVPDSEEDGVTACKPWLDAYPVNGGAVFGGVGTSGGYAFEGGEFEGPQLEVIAWGGVTINADGSFDIVASCYGVDGSANDTWSERPPLLRPAVRAGNAKFGSYEDGEFWWVSGGTSQDGVTDLSTSQVYDFSRIEWIEGPELPVAMQGHCKVIQQKTKRAGRISMIGRQEHGQLFLKCSAEKDSCTGAPSWEMEGCLLPVDIMALVTLTRQIWGSLRCLTSPQ